MKLGYHISEAICDNIDSLFSDRYAGEVRKLHGELHDISDDVNDYKGWVDYPGSFDMGLLEELVETAKEIRSKCTAFVVIGIGGSYLGAKAAIDFLEPFYNERKGNPRIYFAGQNVDSVYHSHLLEQLRDEEVCICIISKSGSTLEPSLAFELFKKFMYEKYGYEGAAKRIYAVTDKVNGKLRAEADHEGYKSFVIPDNIGGRYSVLTPVGLLPIAVAGIDIRAIIEGAASAQQRYDCDDISENICYQYAVLRHFLQEQGKFVEIFQVYETSLNGMTEWLKQLFGESECKASKGIIPMSLQMSTDLHSMGQMLQEGRQIFFETVLTVDKTAADISFDGIEPAGCIATMHEMNAVICESALKAHTDNGTPHVHIELDDLSPKSFGEMVYFFEKACAMSCMLTGVNPFDQPGVEAYKRNIKEKVRG